MLLKLGAIGAATVAAAAGGIAGHKQETPLTGTQAAKVSEAASAKVKGGSIIRVETNTDGGGPYEAHMKKPDGSQVIVLVDKSYKATSVEAFGGPGGPDGPGR